MTRTTHDPKRLLIGILFVFLLLSCNLPSAGSATQPGGSLPPVTLADLPGLAVFGELVSLDPAPVSAEVGPQASMLALGEGATVQIFAGAFPQPNLLQVSRAQVAFDRIAPDASAGKFFVLTTREAVPALGAPVILELPRPEGDVVVVRYEAGAWTSVKIPPGDTVQISVGHFSTGLFGLLEFLSQRRMEAEQAAEGMDNNMAPDRLRARIEGGDEWVRSFYGVNDSAAQSQVEMCNEIKAVLRQFNTPKNREFPYTSGTTKGLADFLFAGSSPSDLKGPYYELTEFTMDDIDEKLLATEGPISPAEFLKIAIEANDGNIPKGVLAAHNYLKDITYNGRNAYKPTADVPMPREYGEPVAHLRSWRQDSNVSPAGEYDKMGPIYHIFAAMTGGLWLPTSASGPVIQGGEQFLRTFRVGGDRPDLPKAAADQCGIDAAAWLRDNEPAEEVLATRPPVAPAAFTPFSAEDCEHPGRVTQGNINQISDTRIYCWYPGGVGIVNFTLEYFEDPAAARAEFDRNKAGIQAAWMSGTTTVSNESDKYFDLLFNPGINPLPDNYVFNLIAVYKDHFFIYANGQINTASSQYTQERANDLLLDAMNKADLHYQEK